MKTFPPLFIAGIAAARVYSSTITLDFENPLPEPSAALLACLSFGVIDPHRRRRQ